MARESTPSEIFRRRLMIDGVDWKDAKDNQSAALDHLHDYYKKALHRLPPKLIPSLLEAGFSFGFLDPVSNIIANTVSQELQKSRKRKRSRAGSYTNTKKGKEKKHPQGLRDTAISKIITESSKGILLVPRFTTLRNSSIAARSLAGLVTFLTSYFRYLTTCDALRYLRLSEADLLVAVRLIHEDRDIHTFTIHVPTAKIALQCAAISALHPTVAILVSRSFSLASCVDKASNLLATQDCISYSNIKELSKLFTSSKDTINQLNHVHHAVSKMQRRKMKTIPVELGLEISLKMVLLDRIHLFYLEAISCIPKIDLCSRHHRGLLKAGHCYGPFDPVTNIILNTIWYDTMFPPTPDLIRYMKL